jgi:TRAP transporter TAXI family solute receptor
MRAVIVLAAVLLATPLLAQQEATGATAAGLKADGFFTLASGDVGGNYFSVARALCRAVNRDHPGVLRCSPEATPGSVYNLTALGRGDVDFAVVQSDWLAAAADGTGPFAQTGPIADLRGVAVLYSETVTILAAPGAPAGGLVNLAAERIDIGPPGSGRRATVERILDAAGMPLTGFAVVTELPVPSAIDELCAGRVDVVALVSGHPDPNVNRAIADCDARLVPILSPPARQRIEATGLYRATAIAAESYPGQTATVPTYAVSAVIVTRADAEASKVMALIVTLATRAVSLARSAAVLSGFDPARTPAESWPEDAPIPLHSALAAAP